ncbi:MAG: aminoacetone oxidase family FAD-binding enzyme [Clostridia bacterium]|nr:aminoacetone oxidase family FAD-binding enzyme [Clostridia bacterium]
MKYDVLIIGGGAAGLTAALSASRQEKSVILLEAAPRIGRKILATGNGRCNLANSGPGRYYGGKALAREVLSRCPVEKVLSFFEELGLITVEEEEGRIYPGCGQAAAVLDVLRGDMEKRRIPVVCDSPVIRLEKAGKDWKAVTSQGDFLAHGVVIACGGMAGGKLGHDGSAYRLLSDHGHQLIDPRPALTQMMGEKGAVKGLSGLRLPARLTLCDGNKPVSAAQGEALFTDYGVSGVCAMQLSADAGALLEAGKKPVLYLDFSPMMGLIPRIYDRIRAENPEKNLPLVQAFLKKRAHTLPKDALLRGLAPRLLAEKMKGLSLTDMARMLCAFPVPILGLRGMEYAQVTRGGMDTREFFPDTLQSRRAPGLYAAGEMLDVDGDCGGFNLQFAFASGLIAGAAAANRP